MSRRVALGRAGLGAILTLTACGGGSQQTAVSPGTELMASLCRSRQLVSDGMITAAGAEFMDHAHQPLHELAARLDASERAAAASLLEAKQRVEAALDDRQATLVDDLDRLVDATTGAIVAAGEPRPARCER